MCVFAVSGTELLICVDCVLIWLNIWDVVGLKFCIALGFSPSCILFWSLGKREGRGCNVDVVDCVCTFFIYFIYILGTFRTLLLLMLVITNQIHTLLLESAPYRGGGV